jgi:hypothetical protein
MRDSTVKEKPFRLRFLLYEFISSFPWSMASSISDSHGYFYITISESRKKTVSKSANLSAAFQNIFTV